MYPKTVKRRQSNTFKDRFKGKTSIIISHRVSTLKDTDYIIVLEKGKIIEQGTHQSLLKRKGFYYKINKIQGDSI